MTTTLVIESRSRLRQGRVTGRRFWGVFLDDGSGATPSGWQGSRSAHAWCLCGREHNSYDAVVRCERKQARKMTWADRDRAWLL